MHGARAHVTVLTAQGSMSTTSKFQQGIRGQFSCFYFANHTFVFKDVMAVHLATYFDQPRMFKDNMTN